MRWIEGEEEEEDTEDEGRVKVEDKKDRTEVQ